MSGKSNAENPDLRLQLAVTDSLTSSIESVIFLHKDKNNFLSLSILDYFQT